MASKSREEILNEREEELKRREFELKLQTDAYNKNRKIDTDYEITLESTRRLELTIKTLELKRDLLQSENDKEVIHLKEIIRLKDAEIERLYNLLKIDKQYQK